MYLNHFPIPGTVEEVKEFVQVLEAEFESLKKKAIELLEASKFSVKDTVYELKTLPVSERYEHKDFLMSNNRKLRESKDHEDLFSLLDSCWSYLSPTLLGHLVRKLPALNDIESDMQAYMGDLRVFKEKTPIKLFRKIYKENIEPPEGFDKIAFGFNHKINTKKPTMKEANVHSLAVNLMSDMDPLPLPVSSSTAEHTSSDKEATDVTPRPHTPPPLEKESPSCQILVEKVVKSETNSKQESKINPTNDLLLELVHMIDTGGQPELMEVMPSLIHNANLGMVLVNLQDGLDKCPKINYHENDKEYKRHLSSHYTGRDIILKLVSTLHAKKSHNQAFRLLIVATHRDCLGTKLESEVEALNTELRSLLLPEFEDELILYKAPKKLPFILKLKDPEDKDKQAFEVIRRETTKPGLGSSFETPVSFFLFEQDLLQFAEKDAKRYILSLDECNEVAKRAPLNMSDEMVEAALVFFHRQNTFLYFRHVLPNQLFVKPQVALEIVNSIVSFRYKVNDGEFEGFPANFVTQLNEGIVTEELLTYDEISPHFKEDIYEVQDAIKLFCHTFILAPLQLAEESALVEVEKRKYLMMCLMPDIPKHELNDYIPKSSDTIPLVVKFNSGCVPLGCFGSTIACLISKYGWEVITKKDKFPTCLAHNIAYLHDPDVPVSVVLVDFTQYIELHVEPDLDIHDSLVEVCSQVHSKVLGAIESVFNIMHLDTDLIKISCAVLCSICTEASEKHFAEFVNCKGKYLLRCGFKYGKPSEKQLLWMGIDAASKDPLKKPTLPLLQRFPTKCEDIIKIIEKIGTSNHVLGIRLLDDKDGTITANIEAHYKHDPPNRATEAILQKWLQGTGRTPQTWDTLITVLREIELNTLAQEIEENLLDIQVQIQRKQTPDRSQKSSAITHQTERQKQYKSEPTQAQNRTTWKQVFFWSICVVILAFLLNLLLSASSYLLAY